jgi:nucleoside-diphosphate-sugar epimerase
MRILVIGGTGFIGPYVVRRLVNAGHVVTVCHRGQTETELPREVEHIHHPTLAYGDRSCFAELADKFRHVAPEVVLDTTNYIERDAQALMNTFRGLARRAVVLSSIDVYRAFGRVRHTEPGPPDPMPLTEDSPLREKFFPVRREPLRDSGDPEQWVDDSEKILVERIVMNDPTLPGTVLRLPATYGSGDPQHRLFMYVKRMVDKRPAIFLDEGLARWRWSRGHAENVAHAIRLAIADDRSIGRIYNVAEAEALTEAEWVRRIGRAADWEGKVIVVPKDQLPAHLNWGINTDQHWEVDTTRIRQELGYQEIVPQAEALRRTVEWERANPPAEIKPEQFDYAKEDTLLAE